MDPLHSQDYKDCKMQRPGRPAQLPHAYTMVAAVAAMQQHVTLPPILHMVQTAQRGVVVAFLLSHQLRLVGSDISIADCVKATLRSSLIASLTARRLLDIKYLLISNRHIMRVSSNVSSGGEGVGSATCPACGCNPAARPAPQQPWMASDGAVCLVREFARTTPQSKSPPPRPPEGVLRHAHLVLLQLLTDSVCQRICCSAHLV